MRDVSFLSDPCPLPDKEKKRSLNEKERLIYAPMSGVGGIVYDKDVVYVELGSHKAHSQTIQVCTSLLWGSHKAHSQTIQVYSTLYNVKGIDLYGQDEENNVK